MDLLSQLIIQVEKYKRAKALLEMTNRKPHIDMEAKEGPSNWSTP